MSMHAVKIIDNASGEVLFTCSLEQIEKAYTEASQYEDYGLDVRIEAPTLTQTLAKSLGIEGESWEKYHDSVIAEIHDHEGCSTCENTSKDTYNE